MTRALFDRSDYPVLRDAVYLNQASLGLIGTPAVDAMHDLLDRVARHGNVYMSDDDEMGFLDALRGPAAELFQIHAGQVTITASASELLGQAPFLLAPEPDSTVLLVGTDFPAITRPWLRLAERGGCRVAFVDEDRERDLTDDLIYRLDGNVSAVAVGWIQYATGTVIDVPRLRAATREVGAALVLDITQGAGALPTPLGEWGADIAVSSGYKWLGGHGGVALGAVSAEVASRVPPLPGWMGAGEAFDFDATSVRFAPDARRFTQSTMSYVSVAGLAVSLEQILGAGLERIETHASVLQRRLIDRAVSRGWEPFRQSSDPGASAHIVTLGHPDHPAAPVVAGLRDSGVVCSARLDRVRVSIAPYNDDSDIDALLAALP